ncbi:uncharacterized protein LOC114273804 [Camellia sinensis]|uniref:uncharacterized protein LOC114273804 n=1 Tax=Camellia sinensis TaxID=4442 RepID=UPI001035B820|nr:uncharacterized protein LOC114273804 [Camellia sinensis]
MVCNYKRLNDNTHKDPRSGLALLHGIDVGAGVIDPDYRGEIKVLLFNHNQEEFEVRAGDRIAQIIFEKVSLPRMVEKDARNLCDIRNDERHDARNWRSTEGFGSTGKAALQYIPYNQKPLLQEQQEYIRWCEAEMKRLREESIQYKTELEELKLIIKLQDDERELRMKGKYKEEEIQNCSDHL